MKTTILIPIIIAIICISNLVKAQSDTTYKEFKVDFALGLGNPVAIEIEPHFRFSDAFALGLRLESAVSDSWASTLNTTTLSRVSFNSYTLTGDYYFNKGKKQSSVLLIGGAGFGIFTQYNNSTTSSGGFDNLKTTSSNTLSESFAILLRAGIETGHFRTMLEYNYTSGIENYYCLSIGFFLGGGKK